MYFKLAWRNVWRNRRRTIITIASVFFAVVLTIIMHSATTGLYEKMVNDIVSFSSGYIQIHQKGYWNERVIDNGFTEDLQLKRIMAGKPEIKTFVPRLESFALASSGEITKGVVVIGISPGQETELTHLEKCVVKGEYLTASDTGVLISEGVAKTLGLDVLDTIVLIGQGYHGASAAAKFPVKGIVSLASPELNKRMIYLPLLQAQNMYDASGLVTSISLQLQDADDMPALLSTLKAETDSSRYEIMSWKEMMPELDQLIEADRSGHMITINVLYLVISFGLFGTILMMTNERIREMGILIAIGMKKRVLAFVFLLEILLIAFVATIAGAAVSIPLLLYFVSYPIRFTGKIASVYESYGMNPVISLSTSPSIFLTQAATVFFLALVLSTYPIIKISRLKPIVAIHS